MHLDSRSALEKMGFTGFSTIATLLKNRCDDIPKEKGVYLVMLRSLAPPNFLARSTGGFFKGKDPTTKITELKKAWVGGTRILYIGKAGNTLRSRILSLVKFGCGCDVGHYGGRYLWQLDSSQDLLVCWKVVYNQNPRVVEKQLLAAFADEHDGLLPYANLNR